MLFAHNLAVESAISRSAGVSFLFTVIFRLVSAFLACWVLNLIYTYLNYLNQPFVSSFSIELPQVGLLFWFKDQALYLFYIFIIVVVLVTLLRSSKIRRCRKFFKKNISTTIKIFWD